MTDSVTTVLSIGAIFVQALIVLVVLLAVAARGLLADIRTTIAGKELWLAFALAALATAGSLFFSEYSNFIPCRLCWYQRIAMYPLVVVLLGAAIRRDVRGAFIYGAPLTVIGSLVAGYHIYIEYHPEAETAGCKIGAPCTTMWIDKYGYITIPVLAITAFVGIFCLLAIAWTRRDRVSGEALPA